MSFAEHQGGSDPVSSTRTIRGIRTTNGCPPMAIATSSPPAPIASIPSPPHVGVWLSEPRSVFPGIAKRSRCTKWQMPFPARERYAPNFAAVVARKAWSSAFSYPVWSVL